jgi:hypothetical protein
VLGKTQNELLRSLTRKELLEWQVYDRIEPFGEQRADLRSAIVATVVNNSQGGKAKVKDFMPTFEPPKKQTASEMAEMFANLAKSLEGKK